jgi:hypothetical protein
MHGVIPVFPFVGIHVLSDQGDFAEPPGAKVTYLAEYGFRVTASFPAPYERYNAIGAHVVTPPHDGNKSGEIVFGRSHRGDVSVCFFLRKDGIDSFLPGFNCFQ